ncbi:YkgJ family cysteine cluster protein [Magnetospira thiophila]
MSEADGHPIQPTRLKTEDRFCFSCHPAVSCWNNCCHGSDITLTPGDVLRLSKRLMMRPSAFVEKYTLPALWPKAELPVVKLRMGGEDGRGACVFLRESGCSIYKARPETCRLYPLGLASAKMTDEAQQVDFHFLIQETHCQGHKAARELSVEAYRIEQEVGAYADIDRAWIDILMKMVSWNGVGGVNGKATPTPTKRMFYTVATDPDAFRRFVFETRFLQTYAVDEGILDILKRDDRALMRLGFDWMNNVLFNEPTLSLRPEVLQAATAKAREDYGAM